MSPICSSPQSPLPATKPLDNLSPEDLEAIDSGIHDLPLSRAPITRSTPETRADAPRNEERLVDGNAGPGCSLKALAALMHSGKQPRVTVHLTFQPPSRSDRRDPPPIHRRTIENVPKRVAEKMARDFRAYESNSLEDDPQKLYRYRSEREEDLGERITALDFLEIIDLTLDDGR